MDDIGKPGQEKRSHGAKLVVGSLEIPFLMVSPKQGGFTVP